MSTRKPKLLTALLAALTAGLLVLTYIPGTWILKYYNPGGVPVRLKNFYTCFSPFSILSGLACTAGLPAALASLRKPRRKWLTAAGVLLEAAALLSVADPIYQVLFHYFKYPDVPLASLNPEWTAWVGVYCAGALAASALAFYLRRLSEDPAPRPVFSQGQMALCCLAIAAILALGFVNRGWKWNFSDGSMSFACWYEGGGDILTELSLYLTAVALYLALQHVIGLVKGRPAVCAALLLVAAALIFVRILLTYVSSDSVYTSCVPLPLTYCITAAQIALGLRLLRRGKKQSAGAPAPRI